MAVGQAVLSSTLDVGALDAVEARLEVSAVEDCARHGRLLRDVLELHDVLSAAGAGLSTTAQAALLRQVSEQTAQGWLLAGQLLRSLPGGLEALDCGLLTVGQSQVLVRSLAGLEEHVQRAAWAKVQRRLLAALDGGAVLPPARFAEVVRAAVVAAEPADAVARRRAAERHGDVEHRRRDDDLVDLFALGLTAPTAQAVLQRIRARSAAFGSEDERPAGKRRLDALVDLLLGRDVLPTEPVPCGSTPSSCGCRLGSPVPCGAEVSLLVPIGAALGTTDELAELVGHGPVEPDLLEAVLLSAPRVRTVWVDEAGVPVATATRTTVAERGDPEAVQRLLLRLAQEPPPDVLHPRHPDDNPRLPDDRPLPAPDRSARSAEAHAPATEPPSSHRRLLSFRCPCWNRCRFQPRHRPTLPSPLS